MTDRLPYNPRIFEYIAVAGQTHFPVAFPYQDDADVSVLVLEGASFRKLARGADYSLVEQQAILKVGLAAASVLQVKGTTVLKRKTSVTQSGRLNSRNLDTELDRSWMNDQEQRRDINDLENRAPQVPYGEKIGAYPPAAERAGRVTGFNQDGDPVAGPAFDAIENAQANAARAEKLVQDVAEGTVPDGAVTEVKLAKELGEKIAGLDALKDKADKEGVAGPFAAQSFDGSLNHTTGYQTMGPYNAEYDDGSLARSYYDGKNGRVRWSRKSGEDNHSPLKFELGEIDLTADDPIFLSGRPLFVAKPLIVGIPTDFPDLQTALNKLGRSKLVEGQSITLMIEAGYVISSATKNYGGDFRGFVIASEDDEVPVSSALGDDVDLFVGKDAFMPRLECLIDANGNGGRGIILTQSQMVVSAGCGIKRAGYTGAYANLGSRLVAVDAVFTYAGSNGSTASSVDATGITARRGSIAIAAGADVSYSERYGISSSMGSTVYFNSGKAKGCKRHNIRAEEASFLSCNDASARDAGAFAVYAWRGAVINANGADVARNADAVTQKGIYAADGSLINARRAHSRYCT
ncbi:hypothetical protein, partial [Pseudovibrio sp. POLY-S9]|uniref:hypothetical protein n=1 Tax=Pseudovibrio sp. POLY-S9 TaxID=1576596 RepID=UPI000710CF9D